MDVNRRTVLLGLGTVGVGVGGAFSSGAFTSVEATRTVEINTADDANAILSFEPNNPGNATDNNIIDTEDVGSQNRTLIKIKQDNLNEQATTKFEDTLKVTNDGEKDVGVSVNPDESTDPNNLIGDVLDVEDTTSGNTIVDGSTEGDNAVDLDSGSSITLTIVVDLRGSNSGSDISTIDTIVFAAREGDHSTN